jgi:hypothetical protein
LGLICLHDALLTSPPALGEALCQFTKAPLFQFFPKRPISARGRLDHANTTPFLRRGRFFHPGLKSTGCGAVFLFSHTLSDLKHLLYFYTRENSINAQTAAGDESG